MTAKIIVFANEKGGTGKSTLAMHTIVALLRAGKKVASFDLDPNQQSLTRYIENRKTFVMEKAFLCRCQSIRVGRQMWPRFIHYAAAWISCQMKWMLL